MGGRRQTKKQNKDKRVRVSVWWSGGSPPQESMVTNSVLRVAATYLRDLDHGGRLHVGQLLDAPLTPNHVADLKAERSIPVSQ